MTTLMSVTSSSPNSQSDYLLPNGSTVIDSKLSPLSLLIQTCKNVGRESSDTNHRPSASRDVTPTTDHFRSRRQEPSKSNKNVHDRCDELVARNSNEWKKRTTISGTLMTSSYKNIPITTSTGYNNGELHLHNGVDDNLEVEFNFPSGSSKFDNSKGTENWLSVSDSPLKIRSSTDETFRCKQPVAASSCSPFASARCNHGQKDVSKPFQIAYSNAHSPVETSDPVLHERSRFNDLSTHLPLLYALANQLHGAAVPDMATAASGVSPLEALGSYLSSSVGADGGPRHDRQTATPSSVSPALFRGFQNVGSRSPSMFNVPIVQPDCFAAAESTLDVFHPSFQHVAATLAHYHEWRRQHGRSFDTSSTAIMNGATPSEFPLINPVQSIRPSTSSSPSNRSPFRSTPAVHSKSAVGGLSAHSPSAHCTSGSGFSCFRRCSSDVVRCATPSTIFGSTSGAGSELDNHRHRVPFASATVSPPSSLRYSNNSTSASTTSSHVCSWLSASTGSFCGQRFADADSLFHHLRSHCNDQRPNNAAMVSTTSRLYDPQHVSEAFQTAGGNSAASSFASSLYPLDFAGTLFKTAEERRGAIASGLTPSSSSSRYHPYRSTFSATSVSHGKSDALGRRENYYQRHQTVGITASSALQSAAAMRL